MASPTHPPRPSHQLNAEGVPEDQDREAIESKSGIDWERHVQEHQEDLYDAMLDELEEAFEQGWFYPSAIGRWVHFIYYQDGRDTREQTR